jgi:energy-coupling factor transporter ATP-binding protein EcfA2
MYIKYVNSNVKGGIGCDLGPKTLIIGPRGSGKSAVVNAIQFALTQKIDDIAGRTTVAAVNELLSLAPEDQGLYANVVFADGITASCTIDRSKTGGSKPKHVFPNGLDTTSVFPLRAVTEALTGSTDSVRKFLLSYAVGKITDKDINELIPESVRDYYRRILQSCSPHITPVDRLLEVLAKAESHKREATSRANVSGKIALATAQGLQSRPTEEALSELRAEIDVLKKALEKGVCERSKNDTLRGMMNNTDGLMADARHAQCKLQEILAKKVEVENSISKLKIEVNALPKSSIGENIVSIIPVMDMVDDECIVCGTQGVKNVVAQRRAYVKNSVSTHFKYIEAYNAMNSRYALLQDSLHGLEKEEAYARNLVLQNQISRDEVAKIVIVESIIDIDGLKNDLSKKEQVLRRMEGNAQLWRSTQMAKEEELRAEKESEEWARLVESCKDVTKTLLDDSVEKFVAKIQSLMPVGYHFFLKLRSGKSENIRIGFEKNGIARTALSGGEWASLTAAVADACTRPEQFTIIVPEDRGTDSNTLVDVLIALQKCRSQVIYTSTVEPDSIPDGWTVIRTLNGDHRKTFTPIDVPMKKKRNTKKIEIITDEADYDWKEE